MNQHVDLEMRSWTSNNFEISMMKFWISKVIMLILNGCLNLVEN